MVSEMDRLYDLGKKVCVAGAVLVSLPVAVPIIVPSLFVLSIVGVALAIPVGSAAVGFAVVKRVLASEKRIGYISAPPIRLYESKRVTGDEILAQDFGEHGAERGKDFAACDGGTEIEEEALAPAYQLCEPKNMSGNSVDEIIEEDSVEHGGEDFPMDTGAFDEAESKTLVSPTQNMNVSGDARSDEVVQEDSGKPGDDSDKGFAAAWGEHVKAEPKALTLPAQGGYEIEQVNGHPEKDEVDEVVENDSVRQCDESTKDNAGCYGATESKEAAGAVVSHVSEEHTRDRGFTAQPHHQNLDFVPKTLENCEVETSPTLTEESSPKLLMEESIDNYQEPVVQVADVGEICAEEAPEKCWETTHKAVEPIYVKDFEDVTFPCKSAPDFYECMEAEEMQSLDHVQVPDTLTDCNVEAAKDVDLPPREVSSKLLKPDAVPEPVDVADVSVELAPEMCWEIATKAAERICVKESEDVDSLKNTLPCKAAPDFYEQMDVKEFDSGMDDNGQEPREVVSGDGQKEREEIVTNAQQASEAKEINAEIGEDEVASASGTMEGPLNRVESSGCLEESTGFPVTSEGEEQMHFNAGGSTDGQEHREDPTASLDEPGALAENLPDESSDEAFRGVASEDDQSRSCVPKSEVNSFLNSSVSMIPV